jgi:pyruvate-formate lyase-activating enzyme
VLAKQKLPYLVVSDADGNLFEYPPYLMAGMSLSTPVLPDVSELIELPYGSNLFMLPRRIAIGYDPVSETFKEIPRFRGNPVYAASAFMAPAYMQYLRSAYRSPDNAQALSLYAYTALGFCNGKFYVCGIRVDADERQDISHVDLDRIQREGARMKKKYPDNRLVHHLVDNCVCTYGCPAARNFVLVRWECPLPTSPLCNARCLGCISKQPEGSSVAASQARIAFIPEVHEVAEISVNHLNHAPRPVVSFGQGCEGEPLLVGDLLEESIRQIRKHTDRGIINLNTNGSRPDAVERLCRAGLDSIRVSANSVRQLYYERYYQPKGYSFFDVIESLRIVRKFGRWASINYFIFPGFTDAREEIEALFRLIKEAGISMIQTRNFNIDPEWYMREMGIEDIGEKAMGLKEWLFIVKKEFPGVKIGYFNPPREEMKLYGNCR